MTDAAGKFTPDEKKLIEAAIAKLPPCPMGTSSLVVHENLVYVSIVGPNRELKVDEFVPLVLLTYESGYTVMLNAGTLGLQI